MSLLSCFTDLFVDASIITITQAPNSEGVWVDTPTVGATIQGVKYNGTTAEGYRNISWDTAVTDIFVTESAIVAPDDKLRINGIDYECELPDNVGTQGEVYVIGLRSIQ